MEERTIQPEKPAEPAETAETGERYENKKPEFTEEQLKYMQSEIDRRVTSAHGKWDSRMREEIKEREKAVREEEAERREREKSELSELIERAESENKILRNKFRCAKEMEKFGIPATFADMIVCEDTEETNRRLQEFTDTFREAVREEVSRKIAAPNPKTGKDIPSISRKDFREMTLSEQQNLKDTNYELYRELIKNI